VSPSIFKVLFNLKTSLSLFPTDLHTVETRLNDGHYDRLCDFVGDVVRIFENCRLYNQPNSQIAKCSEQLETFFVQKLQLLREKIAANHQ
jgi:hypothetical protein